MIKISVIVPVYNIEPYIRECLDSIVNQTYSNLEIILVDDGSTDGTGGICDEYAQKSKFIHVASFLKNPALFELASSLLLPLLLIHP